MFVHPHLIRNAIKEHQSAKSVMEGMVKSAMMPSDVRQAMDGLITSALPAGAKMSGKKSGKDDEMLMKVKPDATKKYIGARHYPGSSFA